MLKLIVVKKAAALRECARVSQFLLMVFLCVRICVS